MLESAGFFCLVAGMGGVLVLVGVLVERSRSSHDLPSPRPRTRRRNRLVARMARTRLWVWWRSRDEARVLLCEDIVGELKAVRTPRKEER